MSKSLFIFILCSTLIGVPITTLADQGIILHVIDGDTLIVKLANKIEHVRILGIDTPELNNVKLGVAQCYSHEALQEVKKLVRVSKMATLQKDALTKNRDIYGRYLRHVYLGKTSLSEYLVKNGFAKVYARSPASNTGYLLQLQTMAQKTKKGLWKWCKK